MVDYELLNQLYEGVYILDNSGRILFWNNGAERITGFTSAEVVDKFSHDNVLNAIDDKGRQLYLSHEEGDAEHVYVQHKSGYRIPVKFKSLPLTFDDQSIGALEIFTETHCLCGNQIGKGAMDKITGLASKAYVEHTIINKLNIYRNFGVEFGIMIVDVDNFEAHNQTYGRLACDYVLKILASSFRNVFTGADLIGRWRGDEFVFLFSNGSSKHMKAISEKIRIIAENSALRGELFRDIDVTVSVGGTKVNHEDNLESIIYRVLEQLKTAKSKDGNHTFVK
ncbi:MAG: sensor domain-containing diguanylate cyclase [Clostridia bacterium]|nr:sensor domain-containing diguanylate cyclase [Clostridia bacterium]